MSLVKRSYASDDRLRESVLFLVGRTRDPGGALLKILQKLGWTLEQFESFRLGRKLMTLEECALIAPVFGLGSCEEVLERKKRPVPLSPVHEIPGKKKSDTPAQEAVPINTWNTRENREKVGRFLFQLPRSRVAELEAQFKERTGKSPAYLHRLRHREGVLTEKIVRTLLEFAAANQMELKLQEPSLISS